MCRYSPSALTDTVLREWPSCHRLTLLSQTDPTVTDWPSCHRLTLLWQTDPPVTDWHSCHRLTLLSQDKPPSEETTQNLFFPTLAKHGLTLGSMRSKTSTQTRTRSLRMQKLIWWIYWNMLRIIKKWTPVTSCDSMKVDKTNKHTTNTTWHPLLSSHSNTVT